MDPRIPATQGGPQLGRVKRTDGGIAHDQCRAGLGYGCVDGRLGYQTAANGDAIAAIAEIDGDFLERLEHRNVV